MELELYAFLQFGRQRGAISFHSSLICELFQVIGLEFYAVELVISAEFLYFFLSFFLRQHDVAVFIACEFVEQLLLGDARAVFLFCAEFFRDGEEGHDRCMVDFVEFNLVGNLKRVFNRLGDVGEYAGHLRGGFQPLLFAVEHPVLIGDFLVGRQANQALVGFGIIFVDKMHVVGAYELDVEFTGYAYQFLVYPLLQRECLMVGARHCGFVPLQFEIIIVAEGIFPPFHPFFSLINLSG